MKAIIKKSNAVIFLLISLVFLSCQKDNIIENNQSKIENFKFSVLQKKGKTVSVKNIVSKRVISTKDGVVLLFDSINNYYKHAITIIPHNTKEKELFTHFLNDVNSFVYEFDGITFKNTKGEKLMFAVNNQKGIEISKTANTKTPVYFGDQLSFVRNNKFSPAKITKTTEIFETNDLVDALVIANKDKKGSCSSGGEGSTGCSIDDFTGGCSVSCGSGYYACCKSSNNTCVCITNPKQ
jgi:hypothetical protein